MPPAIDATTAPTSPRTECIVDTKAGFVEMRIPSREEDILRDLGVLHLDGKATRPRYNKDESDWAILKQAGVHYLNTAEFEKRTREEWEEAKQEAMVKFTPKKLSHEEAEILRNAGVTWIENMEGTAVSDPWDHKPYTDPKLMMSDSMPTCTTAAGTIGESTVNSTYAERELLRRLKRGWSSTGEECDECGMPIIQRSRGDMSECVICGVVGEEDEYSPELLEDSYGHGGEEVADAVYDTGADVCKYDEMEGARVFNAHSNDVSTITPIQEHNEKYQAYHRQEYDVAIEEDDARSEKVNQENRDDDEAYKEKMGLLLFEGWEMSSLSCPNCDLPLMSRGENATAVCLRCG